MTTQNKNIVSTHTITIEGNEFEAYRIKNDSNGNPRYVVHFLNLDIKMADYGNIKGLKVYRPRWFGGGYVFQSYNIHEDLQRAYNLVKHFYNPYATKPNEDQQKKMERLARKIERQTLGGLASAFLSNSYYGADSFAMIPNEASYQNKGGYVVYNTFENKAQFIADNEQ